MCVLEEKAEIHRAVGKTFYTKLEFSDLNNAFINAVNLLNSTTDSGLDSSHKRYLIPTFFCLK